MIVRLALYALLLLPLAAVAQSAGDWFGRMTQALATVDFEGTLVYLDGGRVETLKIYRSAQQERERLVTLTGTHREIVREGDTLICIGAGLPTIAYEGSPLARWQAAADALQAGLTSDYSLRLLGRERVAGHLAQALALIPRDDLRYGYRLWLDVLTALPLRIDLIAADATAPPLEQLMFSDVAIGKTPAAADLQPSSGESTRHYLLSAGRKVTTDSDTDGWQVRDLPPGFELRSSARYDGSIQLVYSDGLASVSVYIEPSRDDRARAAAVRAGAVHARSLNLGDRHVYVVGKVPAQTVERFARNVQRRAG